MPRHPTRHPMLQDRDRDILDHVMRYRLTTPEVLHRLFFSDSERNAVTKVTSRLCQNDFLQSHVLYASNVYFTLGRVAAKLTGLSSKKVGPLGSQSLFREYGTLAFCCLSDAPRERLRVSDMAANFPQALKSKLDSSHYYIDAEPANEGSTAKRLGYIWVEGGGPTDHIVRTVRDEIIDRRRAVPLLREFIDTGRFIVTVVTFTPEKQADIIRALAQIQTPVFFRVEAIPDLIHLLPKPRVRHE